VIGAAASSPIAGGRAYAADDVDALKARIRELESAAVKSNVDALRAKRDAEYAAEKGAHEARELRDQVESLTKSFGEEQALHTADLQAMQKECVAARESAELLRVKMTRKEMELDRLKETDEREMTALRDALSMAPVEYLATYLKIASAELPIRIALAALATHDAVPVTYADLILGAANELTGESPIGDALADATAIFAKMGAAALPALVQRIEKAPATAGPTTWQALENLGAAAKSAVPLLRRLAAGGDAAPGDVPERAAKSLKVIEAAK
jgi:hypothetical protein